MQKNRRNKRAQVNNLMIQSKRMNSSNNKKITIVVKRHLYSLLTGLLLTICASMSFGAFFVSAQESNVSGSMTDCNESITYYKSIRIEHGDTLWDIANENLPKGYNSVDEFVEILKDINRLSSDEIKSGETIIVAYTHNR